MSAVLELACELIGRRSVTPEDAGCLPLLGERLQRAGFHVEHLRYGEVENLWATHGADITPGRSPLLVFLGHTDVVPSGPETDWTSPPFAPTIRDGHLYGRGAADMKGAVAAMVVALEQFVAACPQHRGRVGLLLTADEEGPTNLDGVRKVVEHFRATGEHIDWCVVGEPSSVDALGDRIRVGRRGSLSATLSVRGVQGHVASPEQSTGGGTSDGRFIAPLGAEVVEIGPVNATIHQVDECVDVAELESLPVVYRAICERLLTR